MTISRRGFLKAMLAAASAPAFVKADSLMRLAVPRGAMVTPAGLVIWGDGVHDDTAALQAALDGRLVVRPDGTPFGGFLGGGTYRVLSPLVIGPAFSGRTREGGTIVAQLPEDEPLLRVEKGVEGAVLANLQFERDQISRAVTEEFWR